MKHDILKRLYQLEQRQPQSITVIAKDQDGNLHEMSVKDLIETQMCIRDRNKGSLREQAAENKPKQLFTKNIGLC